MLLNSSRNHKKCNKYKQTPIGQTSQRHTHRCSTSHRRPTLLTSTGDDTQRVPFIIDVYGVIEHFGVSQRGVFLSLSVRAQDSAGWQVTRFRSVHHGLRKKTFIQLDSKPEIEFTSWLTPVSGLTNKSSDLHVTPSCHDTQSYTGPRSLYFFSRAPKSSIWLCSSSRCSFSVW